MGRRALVAVTVWLAVGCGVDTSPLSQGWPSGMAGTGGTGWPQDGGDAGMGAAPGHDAATADSGGTAGQSGTGGHGGTAGGDAGTRDSGMATADTGPVCECSGVNDCCDGCQKLNPCAYLVTEPQCQAATCHPTLGCSVTATRQGLVCDDNDPDTRGERCMAGACVGERRDCASGPCCDGWNFRPSNVLCLAAAPPAVPNPPGPSIDQPGGVVFICHAANRCGAEVRSYPVDIYCSGESAACDGDHGVTTGLWERWGSCGSGSTCVLGAKAYSLEALCTPVPGC